MKQIITSALYLLTIFSVSKFVFVPANLYYDLKWLDIPMHIMGGFGVASLIAAILEYRGKKVSFFHLFLVYTTIAVVWELYEFQNGLVAYKELGDWLDTLKDYINGFIGVVVVFLFIRR